MSKPKKFKTKKAAESAVIECQRNGYRAGIVGSGPWMVQATGYANAGATRITYDLHNDGRMVEYSRKEVA